MKLQLLLRFVIATTLHLQNAALYIDYRSNNKQHCTFGNCIDMFTRDQGPGPAFASSCLFSFPSPSTAILAILATGAGAALTFAILATGAGAALTLALRRTRGTALLNYY